MISTVYSNAKQQLLNGGIDLLNDTIKVALLDADYNLDSVNDVFWSDISADEISATGDYSAGGQALANKSVGEDTADEEGYFDADDVLFTGITATFQYIILYKDTGTASTSPLLSCIDLESPVSVSGGNYQITWNADGILRLL